MFHFSKRMQIIKLCMCVCTRKYFFKSNQILSAFFNIYQSMNFLKLKKRIYLLKSNLIIFQISCFVSALEKIIHKILK